MLWEYEVQSNARQHVTLHRGSGRRGKGNWVSKLLSPRVQVHLENFSWTHSFTTAAPSSRKHVPVCLTQAQGWRRGFAFP